MSSPGRWWRCPAARTPAWRRSCRRKTPGSRRPQSTTATTTAGSPAAVEPVAGGGGAGGDGGGGSRPVGSELKGPPTRVRTAGAQSCCWCCCCYCCCGGGGCWRCRRRSAARFPPSAGWLLRWTTSEGLWQKKRQARLPPRYRGSPRESSQRALRRWQRSPQTPSSQKNFPAMGVDQTTTPASCCRSPRAKMASSHLWMVWVETCRTFGQIRRIHRCRLGMSGPSDSDL